MGKAIGIDLGTTFSVAACEEDGKVVVIPSKEGGKLIPSVVAFTEGGFPVVGKLARIQAAVNPWRTVESVKRLMGREKSIKVNGSYYTPQQISGFILKKIKMDAQEFLGEEVEKAVITVPAYFNDNQRQATMEAAVLAGLDVMRIINEPTAASLAYGLHRKNIHHILVWDLGGGTFDVSILELGQGVLEVKAVSGNTRLGGNDWDQRIADYLAEEFRKVNNIDVREDRLAMQRLKEASERAKKELSTHLTTLVRVPFLIRDKDLEVSLSRAKFEELSRDLLEKTIIPTRQALKDAGLTVRDINRVILVGASTRMPAVRELARDFFQKEPYSNINPDRAVAIGASIQAGILSGKIDRVTLVDVNPLSLGIETMGGVFSRIIGRNTVIPHSRSQVFTTARDNQTEVEIHILQGERALASDNISLGKFTLNNIPLSGKGEPQIEVNFHVDSNGILEVSALDLHTENQKSIKIDSSSRLSRDEVEKMLEDARAHREEDRKRKEHIRVGIQAERMIESAGIVKDKCYKVLGSSYSHKIEKAILNTKSALAGEKIEHIKAETEELRKCIKAVHHEIRNNRGGDKEKNQKKIQQLNP